MKRTLFALLLLAAGCLPGEDLPVKETGGSGDYFIECYCQPGREFRLLVTRVLPLYREVIPDLEIPLEASIIAGDTIPLHPRFSRPAGDFPYNYGARARLAAGVDSIHLRALAPGGVTIAATSPVPSPVAIDSVAREGSVVTIFFHLSAVAGEDYYLYILQPFDEAGALEGVSSFLDYGALPPRSRVERALTFTAPGATRLEVVLRRLTRACYDYQVSLNEANSTQHGSITTPIPLAGNITGALGIFTCYTEDARVLILP
ncbi:MAG: DUF4249 domain-containing protein [Odoribacteraceae bacterium]|jgi:hypothetical protein|nr:DUF4249 domain-containing protein [Odoribacteraceae bacterium]